MTTHDVLLENKKSAKPQNPSAASAIADDIRNYAFNRPTRPLPLTYEANGDIGLFHQYAELKNSLYANVWGLNNSDYNPKLPPIMAHRGRLCIGGVQMVIASPQEPLKLPCERNGLILRQCLPEMGLGYLVYGEIADLAILPGYQNNAIIAELFERVVKAAIAAGVKYLFMITTPLQAKHYMQMAQGVGLTSRIIENITLPDYEELAGGKACLTVLDLMMQEA